MRERLETQGTIKSYYYFIDPDLQYVQRGSKKISMCIVIYLIPCTHIKMYLYVIYDNKKEPWQIVWFY